MASSSHDERQGWFASHYLKVIAVVLIFLGVLGFLFFQRNQGAPVTAEEPFVFLAAGDFSANRSTTANLKQIAAAGSDFLLALGDLSYASMTPEEAWCDYVKSHVGETYPFQIVAGNHDADGEAPGQHIANFANCLPDRIGGVVGEYGTEYYFDYPTANPGARFIMISPGLRIGGVNFTYHAGSSRYNWVARAIDDARASGIRWVVVGMHINCVSMRTRPCDMGQELFDMLIERRVDLILQGHEHNYQRSKQLALSEECPSVTANSFNSACVVDHGANGNFSKGAGTVLVIVGAGGVSLYDINVSDPDAGYFAAWSGNNSNPTYGFARFAVTDERISAEFVPVFGGAFTDRFSIAGPGEPIPTPWVTDHTEFLIKRGAVWRYLDSNTRPRGWETAEFDDRAWVSGPAELGYGDGDEATVVSFGGNAANKHITTYFRKTFNLANAGGYSGLTLRLKRDDGAVVYLNGEEALRSNMPEGEVFHTTPAVQSIDDDTFHAASVSPSLLREGQNVVAVEIHQSDGESSDISFDLELIAKVPGG